MTVMVKSLLDFIKICFVLTLFLKKIFIRAAREGEI